MAEYYPQTYPITNNELAGVIVVNVVAVLSTVALFSIILRLAWLCILRVTRRKNITHSREYVFFNTQLGYYAACLLIANMFNSAAGLMGLPFLLARHITEGGLCTSQAMVMQFGNVSTAYFTVSIAVHTFNSLVLRKRQSVAIYSVVISLGWILAGFIAALPLALPQSHGPIYGEYNLTCGVRDKYPISQFLLHLLPIFIASFFSAVLYSLIFLVLRGTLVIKGGVKLTLNPNERWNGESGENYHRFIAGVARSMLWYPVAYCAVLIPYSVTKLLILSGFSVPFQALIFAYVCWFLLGVINVGLLFNTFSKLYPVFDTKLLTSARQDMESFGTTEQLKRLTLVAERKAAPEELQEKVHQYRYPGTPSYPENVASVQSFYGYPISPQRVSPVSPFNGNNASDHYRPSPVPLSPPSSHSTSKHSRQDSADSLLKLPVPPRKTPSLNSPPPLVSPSSLRALQSIDQGRVLSPSTNRSFSSHVVQSTHKASGSGSSSVGSVGSELDIAGWLVQQQPGGSMHQGLQRKPSLTAVRTTYPSPVAVNQRPRPFPSTPSESTTSSPTGSIRRPTWSPVSPSPAQYVARNMRPVPLVGPPPMGRHGKVSPF
ncbi:uncharacterized protein BT62DRAFT_1071644 [Guyanagaster necrorhizus]|uniref:G-protein coupled receptors family 1 profile domain-containing protein n=1 Tax=Guyanagaster necrorhizus TaxID=856835 RepID=A0A9P7W1U9_9AGAR|nr:uncharacterized protein BT62DRAFT_1071644 [Guyanagaster necrorhizus MCA 3950]KAG7451044.1 hypothetical protein BT62DRAFT_1071644 [Guyanagaster necrorhizus MCA 3950]